MAKKYGLTNPDGNGISKQEEKAQAKADREADKRVKERLKRHMPTEQSIGDKAKELAEKAGATLTNTARNVSNTANQVTATVSTVKQAVNDVGQALTSLGGQPGYQHGFSSGDIQHSQDAYGGLSIPQIDFKSLLPTDLLKPSGLPQATQEELNKGLVEYAGATRAQKLYQAGLKYIEEVGNTKQQYHKAQSSVVKAATEGVKVQENIVKYDIANVNLASTQEQLYQADEKLKQERTKTSAARNETEQLALMFEAKEQKRTAEISRINAQTNDIIQKYLSQSIQGVA